jgi:hypothetical protein
VYANAGDTSILNEVTPSSIDLIFCNHSTGTCTGNHPGDTMDLGIQDGAMVFSLDDITVGNHFVSNAPDANGDYHVLISTNFADFGVGALPSGAGSVIAALIASGQSVTYVGWEDRRNGQGNADFDYNDLIFAFANTTTAIQVPEPLTLSLFGAGLAGAVLLRWRRRKS